MNNASLFNNALEFVSKHECADDSKRDLITDGMLDSPGGPARHRMNHTGYRDVRAAYRSDSQRLFSKLVHTRNQHYLAIANLLPTYAKFVKGLTGLAIYLDWKHT